MNNDENIMEKTWEYNIRTDLAIETKEMVDEDKDIEIKGVKVDVENKDDIGMQITKVEIMDENGAKIMNKPIGNYITIECKSMKENDYDAHEEIIKALSEQLNSLIKIGADKSVLVVGLGNSNITPDALGPKVVKDLLVTRHLFENIKDELDDSLRPLSAISPGVMGQTGIETSEIIRGVVDKTKPDLIIAVDALASRRTNRVNTTIQICDTGVSPGAGVGNRRLALNKEELGVDVIAIGVPTVVDAATLVNDTMDNLIDSMSAEAEQGSEIFNMLEKIDKDEKYKLIREVLNPYVGDLFVTPKEVDSVVDRLSKIISNSINISVHPKLEKEDINRYLA